MNSLSIRKNSLASSTETETPATMKSAPPWMNLTLWGMTIDFNEERENTAHSIRRSWLPGSNEMVDKV
jgi:hypothetical protein